MKPVQPGTVQYNTGEAYAQLEPGSYSLIQRLLVNRRVVGSSPTGGAKGPGQTTWAFFVFKIKVRERLAKGSTRHDCPHHLLRAGHDLPAPEVPVLGHGHLRVPQLVRSLTR